MPDKNKPLLRIGKIAYTNTFPIFYTLEKRFDCSKYEFVESVPSALNRLLRNGEIDISPSSSIEYLRYKERYTLIDGHSISSQGPVRSIYLFSTRPIEELNGVTILTSSQSETSVALLDIILKKFYGKECPLRPTERLMDLTQSGIDAYLLIGDDALRAKKTITGLHVYDLGELWYEHTALPFVFALWIVRKETSTEKTELFNAFIRNLNRAKELALKNLSTIAQEWKKILFSRYSLPVTEEELIFYWEGLSYDFSDEHKKGLEMFRKYSEELGLLNKYSLTDR